MKKFFVLFLLSIVELSYSQSNFSFVDDDIQWSYITFRSSEFQGPSYRITTTKKYFGDTTINGFLYKKMFESNDNGETWNEYGYYRESNKKVYAITKGESIENVCYDFNIKPGLYNEYFWVEVDTLSILGKQIPKYNFYYLLSNDTIGDAYSEKEYSGSIIDEIGYVDKDCDISGVPSYTELLCVQKGDEQLWQNSNYEYCYYMPYSVIDLDTNNSTLIKESKICKYATDKFDDDLQFQLKGNVLYIFGTLELSCFSRGNWLLYTIDENTITLEDDTEEESGWIISKDRIFSLNSLQINNCSAELYNISFRGKMYSVQRSTSISTVNHQFTLSPNPVRDILKLSLQESQSIIQIYNMQGKMVLQTECGETANINVSMLSKGVYTLVVNNSVTQTFIKQ